MSARRDHIKTIHRYAVEAQLQAQESRGSVSPADVAHLVELLAGVLLEVQDESPGPSGARREEALRIYAAMLTPCEGEDYAPQDDIRRSGLEKMARIAWEASDAFDRVTRERGGQ